MKSDYYTVTINEELLRQHDYEQNGNGRYEKLAHPSDDSFERSKICPKCGSEIRGYLKIVCSNGTLQIKPICEKARREYFDGNWFWTNLCGAVKQKDLSVKFGRAIRGETVWQNFSWQ